MTLVVSEISRHGVVMVGDSAVTYSRPGEPKGVVNGAAKVQYSSKANIGFAMWGNAIVQGQQMDSWIKNFIDSTITQNEDLEAVGQRLTTEIETELEKEHRPWSELAFGIHLAGYRNGLPRLWHIHCGHANEIPHEPRLYHDYPEDHWTEQYFSTVFFSPGGTASAHLRNGYTPHYAMLYKAILDYVNGLRQTLGIELPKDSLEGHLAFQKILVKFVAGALVAAGEHPGVNENLSSIAFTQNGMVSNECFSIIDWRNSVPSSLKSNGQLWL